MLTYSLSGLISNQLRVLDEKQALQERPWRAVESLAIEAERVADEGGDLKAWSQLPNTNRLGRVYLFDEDGIEINGRELPKPGLAVDAAAVDDVHSGSGLYVELYFLGNRRSADRTHCGLRLRDV